MTDSIQITGNFDGGNPKDQNSLIQTAPDETSGSYCIEGIINHFINNLSPFGFCNSPIELYLIPMANPDGVFNGFCKLTAINGIDLSKRRDLNDAISALLAKSIDNIRPHLYCEFHNWMHHGQDGIYFLNWIQAKRFIRNMPSQKEFKKKWRPMLRKRIFSMEPHGLKEYCRESFSSISVCLEYPWQYRKLADMKSLGVQTLKALIKI